jgi:hypothetical protein
MHGVWREVKAPRFNAQTRNTQYSLMDRLVIQTAPSSVTELRIAGVAVDAGGVLFRGLHHDSLYYRFEGGGGGGSEMEYRDGVNVIALPLPYHALLSAFQQSLDEAVQGPRAGTVVTTPATTVVEIRSFTKSNLWPTLSGDVDFINGAVVSGGVFPGAYARYQPAVSFSFGATVARVAIGMWLYVPTVPNARTRTDQTTLFIMQQGQTPSAYSSARLVVGWFKRGTGVWWRMATASGFQNSPTVAIAYDSWQKVTFYATNAYTNNRMCVQVDGQGAASCSSWSGALGSFDTLFLTPAQPGTDYRDPVCGRVGAFAVYTDGMGSSQGSAVDAVSTFLNANLPINVNNLQTPALILNDNFFTAAADATFSGSCKILHDRLAVIGQDAAMTRPLSQARAGVTVSFFLRKDWAGGSTMIGLARFQSASSTHLALDLQFVPSTYTFTALYLTGGTRVQVDFQPGTVPAVGVWQHVTLSLSIRGICITVDTSEKCSSLGSYNGQILPYGIIKAGVTGTNGAGVLGYSMSALRVFSVGLLPTELSALRAADAALLPPYYLLAENYALPLASSTISLNRVDIIDGAVNFNVLGFGNIPNVALPSTGDFHIGLWLYVRSGYSIIKPQGVLQLQDSSPSFTTAAATKISFVARCDGGSIWAQISQSNNVAVNTPKLTIPQDTWIQVRYVFDRTGKMLLIYVYNPNTSATTSTSVTWDGTFVFAGTQNLMLGWQSSQGLLGRISALYMATGTQSLPFLSNNRPSAFRMAGDVCRFLDDFNSNWDYTLSQDYANYKAIGGRPFDYRRKSVIQPSATSGGVRYSIEFYATEPDRFDTGGDPWPADGLPLTGTLVAADPTIDANQWPYTGCMQVLVTSTSTSTSSTSIQGLVSTGSNGTIYTPSVTLDRSGSWMRVEVTISASLFCVSGGVNNGCVTLPSPPVSCGALYLHAAKGHLSRTLLAARGKFYITPCSLNPNYGE